MNKIKLIFLTLVISLSFSLNVNSKPVPASFADLAEKLMPSVVNISTTTTVVSKTNPFPFQFPPGSPFEDMFKGFLKGRHLIQKKPFKGIFNGKL